MGLFYEEKEEKKLEEKIGFNGLTKREWTILSNNVWNDQYPPRSVEREEHGASFPVGLIERILKCYTKEYQNVFEPFLGLGSTMEACINLSRNCIGIELNEYYYNLCLKVLNLNKDKNLNLKVHNDDCRNLEKYVDPNSINLTVTSPPYSDFIQKRLNDRSGNKVGRSTIRQYSKSAEDFGNLNYNEYLRDITELMKKIYNVTANGGYNIWIVKDWRENNGDNYISLHSDIADCGKKSGFKHIDLIVWNQGDHRKLFSIGFPSVFRINMLCSYIVVFRKVN